MYDPFSLASDKGQHCLPKLVLGNTKLPTVKKFDAKEFETVGKEE